MYTVILLNKMVYRTSVVDFEMNNYEYDGKNSVG